MFALARQREVGVDLERVDEALGTDPVPRQFLTGPERAALAGVAPRARPREALRCWTAKEARVKALGVGLGARVAEIDTSVVGAPPATLRPPGGEPSGWSVRGFETEAGYVATVAVEGDEVEVPGHADTIPRAARPAPIRSSHFGG